MILPSASAVQMLPWKKKHGKLDKYFIQLFRLIWTAMSAQLLTQGVFGVTDEAILNTKIHSDLFTLQKIEHHTLSL